MSLDLLPARAGAAANGPRPPSHLQARSSIRDRKQGIVEDRLLEVPPTYGVPSTGREQSNDVALPTPAISRVIEVFKHNATSVSFDDPSFEVNRLVLPGVLSILRGVVRAPAVGIRERDTELYRYRVASPSTHQLAVGQFTPIYPSVIASPRLRTSLCETATDAS